MLEIVKIFISLFVIMDPFGSIPLFVSLTRGRGVSTAAWYTTGVAAFVLYFFLFFGEFLFGLFNIDFSSLKIGGGLVLGILAIELVTGKGFSTSRNPPLSLSLIGMPMLTGPGVIVSTIIFTNTYGRLPVLLASIPLFLCCWLILRFSSKLYSIIGETGVELLSRTLGLLLVCVAVSVIKEGIVESLQ